MRQPKTFQTTAFRLLLASVRALDAAVPRDASLIAIGNIDTSRPLTIDQIGLLAIRMHGGARGSGAPRAIKMRSSGAITHYRLEAINERALLREFIKSAPKAASDVNESLDEAEGCRQK